jgi:hypothetical protein
VPGGIYFNTVELTISLWIYPQQVSRTNGARIIDFANGPNGLDSIYISISAQGQTLIPFFVVYEGIYQKINANAGDNRLSFIEWQFLYIFI